MKANRRYTSLNTSSMMNNCHYVVKSETFVEPTNNKPYLLFRHPAEAGTGDNGWMKPSIDIQKEDIRRSAAVPEKQFTREEIEKHTTDDDCWIIINDKVYDATSVLSWHPGGKAPIMAHAGRVHQDTSKEFESIHDDYAVRKLEGIPSLFAPIGRANIVPRVPPGIRHPEDARVHQARRRRKSEGESKINKRGERGCP